MPLMTVLIAGFLAGFVGALGLGGGGVLVMVLTIFLGIAQLKAQGINLIFFIPVGLLAILLHSRKGLISWRMALPAVLAGLLGAAGGSMLAAFAGGKTTGRLFGFLLLCLGLHELFRPAKKNGAKAVPGRKPE